MYVSIRKGVFALVMALFAVSFSGCKNSDKVDLTGSGNKDRTLLDVTIIAPQLTAVYDAGNGGSDEEYSGDEYYDGKYYDNEYSVDDDGGDSYEEPLPSFSAPVVEAAPETALGKPSPVTVIFEADQSVQNPEFESDVVPAELITLSPPVRGEWRWSAFNTLGFVPEEDWPADQEYRITFDKKLFDPAFDLKRYTHKFKTLPFTAKIESFRIYQPPTADNGVMPELFAVATIAFSHPVSQESVRNGVTVQYNGKPIDITIMFDTVSRYAYVKTEPVRLREKAGLMALTLKSASAASGKSGMKERIALSIDVPSSNDFFKVNGVYAGIVRNAENEPEQIFTADFTVPVSREQVASNVFVYKLPRKYDNSSRYNWRQHTGPLTEDFLKQFPKVPLAFMDETAMENIQAAKFFISPKENVQLGVFVRAGIQSRNGYVLNSDFVRVLDVPQFPVELRFTQEGTTLTMTGDRTLTFVSRGVSRVKVKVARVMPSRLNHLISQLSDDIKYAAFKNYSFNESDISDFFEDTITLDDSNPAKLNYFSFNLGEYLTGQNSAGVFIVEIFESSSDGFSSGYSDRRLIQITDLGIILKQNLDQTNGAYIVSLRTGSPVPQADVYYLARNGTVINRTKSSDTGLARLPENSNPYREALEPVAIVASLGQDYTFIPLNQYYMQVHYNRFDVGGISMTADSSRGLKGYLFTERGIYRPGDSVHIGMVVKQDDWKSLAGIPMELTVKNPRGQQVLNTRFTMNKEGFAEWELKTDHADPTGLYNMQLSVVKDDSSAVQWNYRQLGSRSFKIEEFKPDTMKIKARITGSSSMKGWLSPEGLALDVTLSNLFGRPAQNRKIEWLYQMAPGVFHFSEYEAYVFTDPYREKNTYRHISSVSLSPGRTDDSGFASVKLDLSNYSGGLYRLTAQAEGFEDGSGDSVAANVSAYISPLKYLVGYKADSKLGYLAKNADRKVRFIAINPDLEKISLADLQYSIIEKSHVSLLVRQRDGTYAFQSMPREKVVKADTFQISKEGTDFPLVTSNPGNFQLVVTDSRGMMVARVDYFVSGSSNLTLSMDKNTELLLKLDKEEYSAGETIEVNIIAPYTGSGLITVEKDRVYVYKWFTADTTSTKQAIQVPADLEGNGYVNVSFIRSPDSREIFMNPYSYAVAPFSVNRAKHTAHIALSVPEEARPGQPLRINYRVDRGGKLLIYAVDEGILQVTGYTAPDPLGEFMRKAALQVRTYQTLNRVLSDNRIIREVAGIGGDNFYTMAESEAALKANLNPFKRKAELPVVFWSGLFDVEAGESSHLTYHVPPHFNGTLRVMAVLSSENAVGVGGKDLLIKAPIIVQPNMPLNMAPGDKAGVSVTLSNNMAGSGADTPIDVEISSDEYFEIAGESKKQIKLSEGFEGRVDFEIVAKNHLGSGIVTFKAGAPAVKDSTVRMTATASVRPATVYDTVLTTGISERKDVFMKDFSRDMYDELALREVTASHSPLLIARGLTSYLVKYPHGCTEQITSQSFPSLYLKGPEGSGLLTEEESQEYFRKMVNMLRARQLPNGGFTMWPGGWPEAHPYATVYAMHYLVDAKSRGYYVPQDLTDNGIKWLLHYTEQISDNMEENRVKVYAAYVLTRNGVVTTAFVTNLEEYLQKNVKNWKTMDIALYMASIYKMLRMDGKAVDLIRSYVPDMSKRFVLYSDFDSSSLRNCTYLYMVGKHFPDMIGKIDGKIVMNLLDSIAGGHYSSILSSYSILALYALAESTQGMDEGTRIWMDTALAKGVELKVDFTAYPTARYDGPVSALRAESRQAGPMGLFLVATEQGFDKNLPDKQAQGIEIQRDYLDKEGRVKTGFVQGDDVTVRLRVRTNGNTEYIENTAIIDLLPGAFEVQNDSVAALRRGFSGSYAGRLFDYLDVREDRLIFYAPVSKSMKEFTYRARVVSRGEFTVPPAYANAMYDPVLRGNTAGGRITVTE